MSRNLSLQFRATGFERLDLVGEFGFALLERSLPFGSRLLASDQGRLRRDEGGDLGWIERGAFTEAFDEAVFTGPVGTVLDAFGVNKDSRGNARAGTEENDGYRTFDDFLATLSSRKRKNLRKERQGACANNLEIEWLTGRDITEAHWDAFFEFYIDTGNRKWGHPYLNRRFFSLLGEAMTDRCLLILVRNGPRYVAGAFNMIGGDCLYGRYWGCIEHHPLLHFEVCYYQAIDYAIAHNLKRVEAGAGGDHKIARGYEPVATYSAHWIADEGFRSAVARFLEQERAQMEHVRNALAGVTPYRKADPEN